MIKSFFNKKKKTTEDQSLIHDDFFNALRSNEYARLDKDKHIYLDYTGGNLYANSQLERHMKLLQNNTFGNPHSTNPTSKFSTLLVEQTRQKVLDFFNANDYYCVFTQNATMALQIVGECYPFEQDGHFVLFSDNHNSVNGIREYCMRAGGVHEYIPMNHDDLSVSAETLEEKLSSSQHKNKLFAFPAQSNVSGVKHDLGWIEKAQSQGWDVILDAAAFVPTSTLDLKIYSPDFVSVSFYKIFGYPTGIGCLLVKKSKFNKLQKRWFAGGTVHFASAVATLHLLLSNHEKFENGTLNYLDLPAVKFGLEHIESIGMKRITERIESLSNYLFNQLKSLTHSNGASQLDIFGAANRANCGGTMIMSFKNPDGSKIDYEIMDDLANEKGISIRSGCFCNPGLDETNHCLTSEEIAGYFTSRKPEDYGKIFDSVKKLRGATRVSVGIATTQADLDAFIDFVVGHKDQTISSNNGEQPTTVVAHGLHQK